MKAIKNLTARALIWRSFSDHARDGKITPIDFIDLVSDEVKLINDFKNQIFNETNPWIVNFILSNTKHIMYNYLPSDFYLNSVKFFPMFNFSSSSFSKLL